MYEQLYIFNFLHLCFCISYAYQTPFFQAPAAFGLVSFLMHAGLERNRIRKHLLVFALAAPALAMLTYVGLSQVCYFLSWYEYLEYQCNKQLMEGVFYLHLTIRMHQGRFTFDLMQWFSSPVSERFSELNVSDKGYKMCSALGPQDQISEPVF